MLALLKSKRGGYDVKRFGKCIEHQFESALAPYFTNERPKVLAVSAAHPFGVQAVRQSTHAVLVTMRVPEGQGLFKLPTSIPTPTGRFDHTPLTTLRPARSRSTRIFYVK